MLFYLHSQGSPHETLANLSEGVSNSIMFRAVDADVISPARFRRECAACAEGKRECDLQRPCGPCRVESRECSSPPNTQAQRPIRLGSRGQQSSASGIATTPSPANDSSTEGLAVNSVSDASSSLSPNSCSYLEIHPYSLVSDAVVASWPQYSYTSAPEDSIGDEAEKYQVPTEWISPTEAQYLRYST